MSILQEVKLIVQDMELGETARRVCPSCGGGSSKEHSLTITLFPNNFVKYNCFRNSCRVSGSYACSGATPLRPKMDDPLYVPPTKRRKRFEGSTVPLTDFEKKYISEEWGIDEAPYWYHTSQFGGRIAMSVRAPKYTHRGWVLRDIYGSQKSKALTYIEDDETPLSWYRNNALAQGTILVEDIPSAVGASAYCTSVALLGTGCGLDRASEIHEYAPRPIYIALDQDATDQSFIMKARWGLLWEDCRVLSLNRDLKNMSEKGLDTLLSLLS